MTWNRRKFCQIKSYIIQYKNNFVYYTSGQAYIFVSWLFSVTIGVSFVKSQPSYKKEFSYIPGEIILICKLITKRHYKLQFKVNIYVKINRGIVSNSPVIRFNNLCSFSETEESPQEQVQSHEQSQTITFG